VSAGDAGRSGEMMIIEEWAMDAAANFEAEARRVE
jgi:hypothetical protein